MNSSNSGSGGSKNIKEKRRKEKKMEGYGGIWALDTECKQQALYKQLQY